MVNPFPNDNIAEIYEDLDFGEVCYEVANEFGIEFSEETIRKMDGTVDSLIQSTAELIPKRESRPQ